jgi:TetR/AcrR family transcriptional regulator
MITEPGSDTEVKIKEGAKKVFLDQGYERATIRMIAKEADVNIALVNYYFRSKEQLFKSIYQETFAAFFGSIVRLLNEETPLEVKIWKIVDRYTDFLLDNPMVPLFILSEIRQNGATFFQEMNVREVIRTSSFTRQLQEEIEKGAIRRVHPFHVIFSLMGNLVFPVMARPIVSYVGGLTEESFKAFMIERKQIIPEMIMAYLRKT